MINRIKSLFRENRLRQKQILSEIKLNRKKIQEIEWAQIFHDSIKGKQYLQTLPLNIGRWAGNYSFFYILNRILMDHKPLSILELGLGESSKFISTYLDNYLLKSKHIIIEHDEIWANAFKERFTLSNRSEIKFFSLEEVEVENYKQKKKVVSYKQKKKVVSYKSNVYKDFNNTIEEKFDLYVIDGPFGSKRYSRYDLVGLVKRFDQDDEFIIIIDDYNRQGEKDTMEVVLEELKSNNIIIFTKIYEGSKTQLLIATDKYKFAATF